MSHPNTRSNIHFMLKKIGINGFDGLEANAPSVYAAFDALRLFPDGISTTRKHQLITEVKRQELINIQRVADHLHIALTIKGIHRLQQAEVEALTIDKQTPWDERWRVVMFDIPARRSESRYLLTSSLTRLGFKMIQRSFWVHPFPCVDVVEKIITYANLQSYVSVAEITKLDTSTERKLRHHFHSTLQ